MSWKFTVQISQSSCVSVVIFSLSSIIYRSDPIDNQYQSFGWDRTDYECTTYPSIHPSTLPPFRGSNVRSIYLINPIHPYLPQKERRWLLSNAVLFFATTHNASTRIFLLTEIVTVRRSEMQQKDGSFPSTIPFDKEQLGNNTLTPLKTTRRMKSTDLHRPWWWILCV